MARNVTGDDALRAGDRRGVGHDRRGELADERIGLDPGAGGGPGRELVEQRLVHRRSGDGTQVGLQVNVGPADQVVAERRHGARERLRIGQPVLAVAVDGGLDRRLVTDEQDAARGGCGDRRADTLGIDRQGHVLVGLIAARGRRQRLEPADRGRRILLADDEQGMHVLGSVRRVDGQPGQAGHRHGNLAAEPRLDLLRPVALPVARLVDESVEGLVELGLERRLVGKAREVGEEPAEVLALIAGQVGPDLDVGDRVGRRPGRDERAVGGADEGVQARPRQGDDDQGDEPGDRPSRPRRSPGRRDGLDRSRRRDGRGGRLEAGLGCRPARCGIRLGRPGRARLDWRGRQRGRDRLAGRCGSGIGRRSAQVLLAHGVRTPRPIDARSFRRRRGVRRPPRTASSASASRRIA